MLDRIRNLKVVRLLGEGGMGTVYLAEDESLGRLVAVKALTQDLVRVPAFVERFRNEARVQASLLHQNIVTLHNFFEESGQYYMVMEYVAGQTVRDAIGREGMISESRSLEILRQVLAGLGFAHRKGIVHRDVKPGNIMVLTDGTVKIMDFGIAKVLGTSGMTTTGKNPGTIWYMSPEQVVSPRTIDLRTDIYSLGVMFFEMLTGRLPYDVSNDETDFNVMQHIVSGAPLEVSSLRPGTGADVVRLVTKMLAKRADDRPDNCEECLAILNSVGERDRRVESHPPPAAPASPQKATSSGTMGARSAGWQLLAAEAPAHRVCAHPGGVRMVRFGGHGNWVISGGADKRLRLWDPFTGRHMVDAGEHQSEILAIAVSRDESMIASGDKDGIIIVWGPSGLRKIVAFRHGKVPVSALEFEPEGRRLFSAGADGKIRIWDIASGLGTYTYVGHEGLITSVSTALRDRVLVSSGIDGAVRLWDMGSARAVSLLGGHRDGVLATAVMAEGVLLASGGNDGMVRIWDLERGVCLQVLDVQSARVLSLAASPGGRYLTTGGPDGTVNIWDLDSSLRVKTIPAHRSEVRALAFSPAGTPFVSAGMEGTIMFW